MFNIQKYFCCYEDLNLWDEKNKNIKSYKENIQKLRTILLIKDEELMEQFPSITFNDSEYCYSTYLFHSLTNFVKNCDLDALDAAKEELISVNNFNLLVKIIQEAVNYGVNPYLPEYFKTKLRVTHPQITEKEIKCDESVKTQRLAMIVRPLKKLFKCKRLLAHSGLEFIQLELLFCYFYLKSQGIDFFEEGETITGTFHNRPVLFQNLMLLKGLPSVPKDLSLLLHKTLLEQLKSNGGFEIFSRLLMSKSSNIQDRTEWQTYATISKIVAAKGHTRDFYQEIIQQIFDFLKSCIGIKDIEKFVPVCLTCLQKLCELSPDLYKTIEEKLSLWLDTFINPPETLTGAIIMTGAHYEECLKLLNVSFGGSTIVSLPSKMLVRYHKVLFRLYCLSDDRGKLLLSPILIHIYKNRELTELKSLIHSLLFNIEKTNSMFERLVVKNLSEPTPSIVVCAKDEIPYIDIGQCFSQFLINTSNMLLINDVFLILLEFLGSETSSIDPTESKGDLLFDEDDAIGELLSSKFMKRLILTEVLQNLINCKQFQAHINGDPKKMLEFIKDMLSKEVLTRPSTTKKKPRPEITMLLLTIFKELSLSVRNKEIEAEMMRFLKEIERTNSDPEINQHISALFIDTKNDQHRNLPESKYNVAMSLLNQSEVYLKVYGIQQFIQLLNEKDSETIANKHVLLILALKTLKITESYAYLNIIRLILALTNVMEPEVIDAFVAEFENQELDVDFRMKIGETTLKIAEALGPITYKYRKELINCFLRGCLNENPDIKTSSLSNIGSLCKILTYQVTNFFNEILLIIHQVLETDTYLPARRSAVLVLSQFLQGMEKLIDYQECLLPIYRTLKYILQTEKDEVTRIHAALSIETLNHKVKEMLVGELVQPEIQLNIKNVPDMKKIDVKYK